MPDPNVTAPKSHHVATCFISYCHADADSETLQYALEAIQEHSKRKILFHYDRRLSYGKSLDDFMLLIDQSDMVLVFLTPQYKERVSNRVGGVYREFRYIMDKYDASTKVPVDEDEGANVGVLPVLFSGSHESAVPNPLAHLKYVDLTALIVREAGGNLIVPDRVRDQHKAIFRRIAEQIIVKATFRATTYRASQADYYHGLFLKLKHARGPLEDEPGYKEVLLETHAYQKVNLQDSYLIVGRKGSGKSTITTMLDMLNPGKYKAIIGIRAENVNLEHAYLNLDSLAAVDTDGVLKPLKYFSFGWQGLFVLTLIERLVSLERKQELSEEQSKHMEPLLRFWTELKLRSSEADDVQQALIAYSVEHVHEFISQKVKEVPDGVSTSEFLAKVVSGFNLVDFFESMIGSEAAVSLGHVVALCKKRVLFTLDDFDSVFDSFRRRAPSDEERLRTSRIEQEWIRALLLLVLEIKNQPTSAHPYFRPFDFCLTIPHDRFSEIEGHDRDGYLYSSAAVVIQWSGCELCELIVRRLEQLYNFQCESLHPKDRLSEILAQEPGIPQTISFDFNGKPVVMPLFLYVLRHTFWRPRDVLLYFANILAAARNIRATGDKISSEVVRRIISETTYQIIKTEFLDEYGTAFHNLHDVINRFARKPQLWEYAEVEKLLRNIPFEVAEGATYDVHRKLQLLFDIGFLGVQMDTRLRNTLNIEIDHAFYFNEGKSALRAVRTANYSGATFIVHPIFTENLILDSSDNPFLLQLTWDYIDNNHEVMVGGGRSW